MNERYRELSCYVEKIRYEACLNSPYFGDEDIWYMLHMFNYYIEIGLYANFGLGQYWCSQIANRMTTCVVMFDSYPTICTTCAKDDATSRLSTLHYIQWDQFLWY